MKKQFLLKFFACLMITSSCITPKKSTPTQSKHYLALGDSYTIGESVERTKNFPHQLQQSLNSSKMSWTEPEIIARTGWRTDQLKMAIESAALKHEKYDLVTLLIGVNNEFQGRSVDQFAEEFEELLQTAIRLTGNDSSKVWVLSIPDYGYTPYGESRQSEISPRIDLYNAKKKEIANKYSVRFVDVTPISRKGLEHPELVANDGLHPSDKMYTLWVKEMMERNK